MYRGVIQHRQYQSEYLRNQIRARGLVQPTGLGRIFRVVHETTRREARPSLAAKAPAARAGARAPERLVAGHGAAAARRARRHVGGARAGRAVADANDARTRLHALCTLDGLGALDAARPRALRDAAPEVRAAAVRVAAPWLAKAGDPVAAAVWALAGDRAPRVRWELAVSIAAFPESSRVNHAASLLARYGRDPFVVDAAVSSLAGLEGYGCWRG